ncbi:MAG: hypothetical protein HYS12_14405 [Planctomycetes bacterium]|nr:hypothetical protein [Planctomycetota bacterium]
MFSLFLILLLLWFVVSGLMATGTLFLQGYFNETPPALHDVAWRAPAAGAAVTVFITLWTILYYNNPEGYAPLTEYSGTEEPPYFPKIWIVQEGQRIEFNLRKTDQGRPAYAGPTRLSKLPARPGEIIVMEDGAEAHFKPDREAQKLDPNKTLSYRDEKGRVMQEGYLGQLVPEKRTGRTFVYILLNVMHGVVWFACLWPLMRFTWGQALLPSVGCWLMMTLVILPPILTQARDVAKERAKSPEARQGGPGLSLLASGGCEPPGCVPDPGRLPGG